MAYEPLPIIETDIDNLILDLENYRIPIKPDDEVGAMKYLFASEDVREAAVMILRDGYFDNEVPIVVAEGKRFIVLEGNRRVSALKALNDPSIIPGHEAEIRSILKRYALEADRLPKKIRVLVAPDRETATPHIARLHTGLSKKRWSLDQQANFYYSLLDSLTTVDDVRAQFPGVSVPRFIKMAVMRRFVSGAKFKDGTLREYAASDRLRMSSLEYAYRHDDIANLIGVTFSDDGHLLPVTKSPERIGEDLSLGQLDALEYLLGEFRADRLNTRSPAFKKDSGEHRDLVAKLQRIGTSDKASSSRSADHPGRNGEPGQDSPRADSNYESNAEGSGSHSSQEPTSQRRGPNHPNTKDTLDFSGIDYNRVPVNLKERYIELRRIRLPDLPIAASILMRAVLETTIKVQFDARSPRPSGQLSEVFSFVEREFQADKGIKSNVSTVRSGTAQRCGSLQWFNLVAHHADAPVTAQDVRDAWKLVSPILRRLLTLPKP